ncbi:hypothetical protein A9Q96_16945 [Rhodobacterales bacterium 52_120_T64]|nr:hypothetical protein A9Q96_16945 [Rhodobacterales bacterium 52_120_T64]
MPNSKSEPNYDTIVVGGGSAGVGAALAAAKNGARTLLIDAGPTVGGELLSGMTIDGAINSRGEPIIGGVLDDLIQELDKLGGYVGAFCDWRLINYHCIDPVFMQFAILNLLRDAGVEILLYTVAEEVNVKDGLVTGVTVRNKSGHKLLTSKTFVDCSGDGDLSVSAGADSNIGGENNELQPVSLMFRLMGVETDDLLSFVQANPQNVAVGESDAIRGGRTDLELVDKLVEQGQPTVFFKSDGPLLNDAIDRGEMYPTALIMIQPTSTARKEVCINSTRIDKIDALDTHSLSAGVGKLFDQVMQCASFLKNNVPGFENAYLSAIAPRVGIRETRRIVGEYELTEEDVFTGRKSPDGIAKGCHHIDIHQGGRGQVRIPIANGGSFDIPFGCLLPKKLRNVLVAGRCLSADRAAHGASRLMGNCLAMGQAAGTATALFVQNDLNDMRDLEVIDLRSILKSQGAILDGTH